MKKNNIVFTALMLYAAITVQPAFAQPGTLDLTFNPGTGASSYVTTSLLQPDGKVIIAGDFTTFNGTARNRIARLNTDGSLDLSFNPGTGANVTILTTALQTDGKIIIGGGFTNYNGTARNHIARLNTDGSLDGSFSPGTGANSYIYTSALQTDGKIVIGGTFTSYNGTGRNYIARVNTDGTNDNTFNPGTGTNCCLSSSALQTDGKIIIGGDFYFYNGTPRNGIARVNTDGSLDTSFDPGTGANGTVNTITLQPNGRIIIGGWFFFYNGISRGYIARVNTDGSLDLTFNPGSGASSNVVTTLLQPDGKIVIGGYFSSYNGFARDHIARLNSDGSLDITFLQGTGADNYVNTTELQSDGKIIIGGTFFSYNGISRNRVARLNGTPVGIEENAHLNLIKISPNPNNGIFTVEWSESSTDNLSIKIFDQEERVVYEKKESSKKKFEIDLRNHSKGIYIVQLEAGKKIYSQNLVIQ